MRWTILRCTIMRCTASLPLLLAMSLFTLPVHPQLGAPLGRCGPTSHDLAWPQNQLPPEKASSQVQKGPAVDMARLQQDAQELADLSASIHSDIERVNQGLLPKEVMEKLRRVEKLSKHLRSELTR
jgi:hypothetical protein